MQSLARIACALVALAAAHAGAEEVVTIFGTTTDEGEILVYRLGDTVERVTLNGDPLPEDRVNTSGRHTTILTPEGKRLARVFAWPSGGQLNVYREVPSVGVPPYMGVFLDSVDPAVAAYLELEADKVCLVRDVVAGGPAAGAGFQAHDIILSVQGAETAGEDDVRAFVREHSVGDTLTFRVRSREGVERTIDLVLRSRPSGTGASSGGGQVPILADIPLIGELFGRDLGDLEKGENVEVPTLVWTPSAADPETGGGAGDEPSGQPNVDAMLWYGDKGGPERVLIGGRPAIIPQTSGGHYALNSGGAHATKGETDAIAQKLDEIARRLDEIEKMILGLDK